MNIILNIRQSFRTKIKQCLSCVMCADCNYCAFVWVYSDLGPESTLPKLASSWIMSCLIFVARPAAFRQVMSWKPDSSYQDVFLLEIFNNKEYPLFWFSIVLIFKCSWRLLNLQKHTCTHVCVRACTHTHLPLVVEIYIHANMILRAGLFYIQYIVI